MDYTTIYYIAGFRGAQAAPLNAAVRDAVQPPDVSAQVPSHEDGENSLPQQDFGVFH